MNLTSYFSKQWHIHKLISVGAHRNHMIRVTFTANTKLGQSKVWKGHTYTKQLPLQIGSEFFKNIAPYTVILSQILVTLPIDTRKVTLWQNDQVLTRKRNVMALTRAVCISSERRRDHKSCIYLLLVYLVTALVPSDTACLANSPGNSRRTAVWISRLVMVERLL